MSTCIHSFISTFSLCSNLYHSWGLICCFIVTISPLSLFFLLLPIFLFREQLRGIKAAASTARAREEEDRAEKKLPCAKREPKSISTLIPASRLFSPLNKSGRRSRRRSRARASVLCFFCPWALRGHTRRSDQQPETFENWSQNRDESRSSSCYHHIEIMNLKFQYDVSCSISRLLFLFISSCGAALPGLVIREGATCFHIKYRKKLISFQSFFSSASRLRLNVHKKKWAESWRLARDKSNNVTRYIQQPHRNESLLNTCGKECFVFIRLPPLHTIDYSHVIIEIKFYLKLEHFVVASQAIEKAKKRKNEPCEELRSLVGLNDFLMWIFDVYVLGSTMKHKKSSARAQKKFFFDLPLFSSLFFASSFSCLLPAHSPQLRSDVAVCLLGWGDLRAGQAAANKTNRPLSSWNCFFTFFCLFFPPSRREKERWASRHRHRIMPCLRLQTIKLLHVWRPFFLHLHHSARPVDCSRSCAFFLCSIASPSCYH